MLTKICNMESSSDYQNLTETIDRKINNTFTAKRQAQDFEMSNVTVVPDGKLKALLKYL